MFLSHMTALNGAVLFCFVAQVLGTEKCVNTEITCHRFCCLGTKLDNDTYKEECCDNCLKSVHPESRSMIACGHIEFWIIFATICFIFLITSLSFFLVKQYLKNRKAHEIFHCELHRPPIIKTNLVSPPFAYVPVNWWTPTKPPARFRLVSDELPPNTELTPNTGLTPNTELTPNTGRTPNTELTPNPPADDQPPLPTSSQHDTEVTSQSNSVVYGEEKGSIEDRQSSRRSAKSESRQGCGRCRKFLSRSKEFLGSKKCFPYSKKSKTGNEKITSRSKEESHGSKKSKSGNEKTSSRSKEESHESKKSKSGNEQTSSRSKEESHESKKSKSGNEKTSSGSNGSSSENEHFLSGNKESSYGTKENSTTEEKVPSERSYIINEGLDSSSSGNLKIPKAKSKKEKSKALPGNKKALKENEKDINNYSSTPIDEEGLANIEISIPHKTSEKESLSKNSSAKVSDSKTLSEESKNDSDHAEKRGSSTSDVSEKLLKSHSIRDHERDTSVNRLPILTEKNVLQGCPNRLVKEEAKNMIEEYRDPMAYTSDYGAAKNQLWKITVSDLKDDARVIHLNQDVNNKEKTPSEAVDQLFGPKTSPISSNEDDVNAPHTIYHDNRTKRPSVTSTLKYGPTMSNVRSSTSSIMAEEVQTAVSRTLHVNQPLQRKPAPHIIHHSSKVNGVSRTSSWKLGPKAVAPVIDQEVQKAFDSVSLEDENRIIDVTSDSQEGETSLSDVSSPSLHQESDTEEFGTYRGVEKESDDSDRDDDTDNAERFKVRHMQPCEALHEQPHFANTDDMPDSHEKIPSGSSICTRFGGSFSFFNEDLKQRHSRNRGLVYPSSATNKTALSVIDTSDLKDHGEYLNEDDKDFVESIGRKSSSELFTFDYCEEPSKRKSRVQESHILTVIQEEGQTTSLSKTSPKTVTSGKPLRNNDKVSSSKSSSSKSSSSKSSSSKSSALSESIQAVGTKSSSVKLSKTLMNESDRRGDTAEKSVEKRHSSGRTLNDSQTSVMKSPMRGERVIQNDTPHPSNLCQTSKSSNESRDSSMICEKCEPHLYWMPSTVFEHNRVNNNVIASVNSSHSQNMSEQRPEKWTGAATSENTADVDYLKGVRNLLDQQESVYELFQLYNHPLMNETLQETFNNIELSHSTDDIQSCFSW